MVICPVEAPAFATSHSGLSSEKIYTFVPLHSLGRKSWGLAGSACKTSVVKQNKHITSWTCQTALNLLRSQGSTRGMEQSIQGQGVY